MTITIDRDTLVGLGVALLVLASFPGIVMLCFFAPLLIWEAIRDLWKWLKS